MRCAGCGCDLPVLELALEFEDGEILYFCSDACADALAECDDDEWDPIASDRDD
jgi:hypothetical protein